MDVLGGVSAPDYFRIDDLLDFSNDELFSSSSTATATTSISSSAAAKDNHLPPPPTSSFLPFEEFNDPLSIPSDDVAELEWLSRFVDDSFPPNLTINIHSAAKSKRPKQTSSPPPHASEPVRRCTHCASEKTPQWRTGPLGPKTLCNACGVRYKSGRLVPEYRPAASPTFVLTQHSNSHRKVLELRRQKEMLKQQQRDFRVC